MDTVNLVLTVVALGFIGMAAYGFWSRYQLDKKKDKMKTRLRAKS